MYPIEPRLLTLENTLLKRLDGYRISDQYAFTDYGYQGEVAFAEKFPVNENVLQLFNVCLTVGQNKFEVDRLLITAETVYAFEVKNYYGIYNNHEYRWEKNDRKLKNPLSQFYLMKDGLSHYLRALGVNHRVVCKVIFIQPTFSLLNAIDQDLIVYKEIGPLMKQIHLEQPCGTFEESLHRRLQEDHRPIQLYHQRPNFNFEELKAGLLCDSCYGEILFPVEKTQYYTCPSCLKKGRKIELIVSTLEELSLLLNRPFTKKEGSLWVSRRNRNLYLRALSLYFKEVDGTYIKNV